MKLKPELPSGALGDLQGALIGAYDLVAKTDIEIEAALKKVRKQELA